MIEKLFTYLGKIHYLSVIWGILFGACLMISFFFFDRATSSDKFCETCHFHDHSHETWKLSKHFNTKSGIKVSCIECHLPPKNKPIYIYEKMRTGTRDLISYLLKDKDKIDWEAKSRIEHASTYTYDESCINCHQNLFPINAKKQADEAHFYYTQNREKLKCINCHIDVGHFSNTIHSYNVDFFKQGTSRDTIYTSAGIQKGFNSFTEQIPGSGVSFKMVAIPAGELTSELVAKKPIKKFFMAEIETTWDAYIAFLRATESEGRLGKNDKNKANLQQPQTNGTQNNDGITGATPGYEYWLQFKDGKTDGITGATPPFGNPDQGWGKGERPAITMTYHAAAVFCKWLSQVTGKKYRLPSEAEWEYACRANTKTPYFFPGELKDFDNSNILNFFSSSDKKIINQFVIYKSNSNSKTALPSSVKPNPFGLKNMLGNVWEFCSDRWNSLSGEHVIRGGSFQSDFNEVTCSSRASTQHQLWMKTDPQTPKSLWWYSDCFDVGFRVVCEYEE